MWCMISGWKLSGVQDFSLCPGHWWSRERSCSWAHGLWHRILSCEQVGASFLKWSVFSSPKDFYQTKVFQERRPQGPGRRWQQEIDRRATGGAASKGNWSNANYLVAIMTRKRLLSRPPMTLNNRCLTTALTLAGQSTCSRPPSSHAACTRGGSTTSTQCLTTLLSVLSREP